MSNTTKISEPVRAEAYEFITNIGNVFFVLIMFGAFFIVPWMGEASGGAIVALVTPLERPLGLLLIFSDWLILLTLLMIVGFFLYGLFVPQHKAFTRQIVRGAAIVGVIALVIWVILAPRLLGSFLTLPWKIKPADIAIIIRVTVPDLPLAFAGWLVLLAILTVGGTIIYNIFVPEQKLLFRQIGMIAAVVGLVIGLLLTLLWVRQDGVSPGVNALIMPVSFLLLFWQMRTFRPVLVLSMALAFCLFPVVWIISASFNPTGSLANQTLIPRGIDSIGALFVNYRDLLSEESLDLYPFWMWMRNSIFVASVTTVFAVMISALAAYAFSRFRFAGRQNLLILVLLIQVFPNMLAMVALFLILQQIGKLSEYIPTALPFLTFIDWSFFRLFGLNSLGGLILVYLGAAMGINTWLMKGFYDSVPRDIDESAQVDGASHWQTFWQLIFPLVRPILAVVAVISFVGTFNEFVLARVLLRDKNSWTVMVGLYLFVSDNFAQNWGKFAAGAVITAVPVVTLYLLLQDQIVGGLTQGAVKG